MRFIDHVIDFVFKLLYIGLCVIFLWNIAHMGQ